MIRPFWEVQPESSQQSRVTVTVVLGSLDVIDESMHGQQFPIKCISEKLRKNNNVEVRSLIRLGIFRPSVAQRLQLRRLRSSPNCTTPWQKTHKDVCGDSLFVPMVQLRVYHHYHHQYSEWVSESSSTSHAVTVDGELDVWMTVCTSTNTRPYIQFDFTVL